MFQKIFVSLIVNLRNQSTKSSKVQLNRGRLEANIALEKLLQGRQKFSSKIALPSIKPRQGWIQTMRDPRQGFSTVALTRGTQTPFNATEISLSEDK